MEQLFLLLFPFRHHPLKCIMLSLNTAASSITTSKRASPIASSLKASLDHLNSTAQKGGGAWLLLRADTEEEAHEILIETNVGEVFDVEKATMQAVELDEMANEGAGPLYDGSKSTDTSSYTSSSSSSSSSPVFSSTSLNERDSSSNDEHLSGNVFDTDSTSQSSKPTKRSGKKEKKESMSVNGRESGKSSTNASKKSTTYVGKKGKTGKGAKENAAVAEEARIGGHAVETSGPLYGK